MPSADTLDGVLLDNMLSIASSKGDGMTIPPTHWFRIWMAALLLIVAGLALMLKLPNSHFASTMADAVLTAGILALVVDPFLKRDLLVEASRGISVHLLGFEHHPQVKEALKKIVYETKLLREELRETLLIEPCAEGFWVTATYETDIINPTPSNVSIEPNIEIDIAHKPEVLNMSFLSTDGSTNWTKNDVRLQELQPGLWTAKGERIECRPGTMYRGSGTYKTLSKYGYFMIFIGAAPTLRTYIRVIVPEGYEVSANTPNIRNGNLFEYNDIKMPGDHLTVRWRKEGGEWL